MTRNGVATDLRLTVAGWALALALALVSVVAGAQRASPEARALLEAGRAHYAELEFLEAVESLHAALRAEPRDEAFRAEVLETLAFANLVLDREEAARAALRQLFALDPYYVVREPNGSPRIHRFVDSVRASLVPDAAIDPALSLRVELPRVARADRSVEIAVGAPPPVSRVDVVYRPDTTAIWSRVEAVATPEPGRFLVRLPPLEDATEVAIYVEARDAQGRLVARDAGPLAPRSLEVMSMGPSRRADEGAGVASEPWFWVVLGAVAVGAAVGIGVAVALSETSIPTGSLPPGVVRLP